MEHSQQYQLGSWIICPRTNTIASTAPSSNSISDAITNTVSHDSDTKKSTTLSIDNKSMQVLLFLIQHAGKQVTKTQIFKHVWKDSFVTEDILSVAVSKIRKALGDNARSPTFIKTLPGVGYVLIAEVQKISASEKIPSKTIPASNPFRSAIFTGATTFVIGLLLLTYFFFGEDPPPSNHLSINSIAVLPFDDLSAKQDNQHFADGLPDAIINQLSQTNSLKVISRYSSFTYRGKYTPAEIGRALKVEALIDGSVQKVGEQVRINVRIFSTNNGQQLWSRTFDSENQNLFKLQDHIGAAVQEIIQPDYRPILAQSKTINAQAYEWYLMGQYHWRQRNPKSLSKAVTYFKHSLELEPDYADAHIGLAITYANLHHYANWSEKKAIDKALPQIEKGLALAPNSPTGLAAKGMILTLKANYETGFINTDTTLVEQAQEAFLRSLELDNNATTHRWYSSLLKKLGKASQVIQHMTQAIELNPLSASLKRSLSRYLGSIGQPDSAQRMYQRALSLEPDHFSHVVESTHIFRHTQKSIITLIEWHSANDELFTNCSSVEYCEQIVLAYLSIGANQAANSILSRMGPKHGHFLNSLDLIELGLNQDAQKIEPLIMRITQLWPNNRRVLFALAVAQFRAENFSQANNTLLKLYPSWSSESALVPSVVTANNYSALVLFAATLINLDKKQAAENLLQNLQTFLKQDKVFDKIQAEFTLAEINAQLNNLPQALAHLATALEMGWLETFDREWWWLQNNHLLRPLRGRHEFNLLLKQHEEQREELRRKVTRQLDIPSALIE